MKVRALIIVAVILAMAGSAWAGECSTAGIDITPLDDLTMAGRNSFRPQDVAVSPNGDVFVTDAVHGKVMVFDRNGKIKRSLERKDPYGIDVDSAGNVYIGWASYNDAGHFTGEVDVYNQWLNYQGTLGTGWAEFKLPYSIATDDTRVYVADNRGNAIKVYDKGTRQLLTSFGGFCQDPGCVVMPSGIAVKDGTIYISDAALSTGTYDGTSGVGIGAGAHIFTIDDSNNVTFVKRFGQYGAGAPGVFQSAAGVAVDGEGRVFVSDSSYGYVQVFNADGNYMCTFSQGEYNMFSRGMEVNAEGKLALSAFDRVFRYGIGQYADLQVSPSLLTFDAQACSVPASQAINLANNGTGSLNWASSENSPWLTLTPASGTLAPAGSDTIAASVNTSGLSEGSYTGIVQVTAPGANESVVVRLNVAGPPELTAAPDSLSFSVVGTDIPASQRLDIGLDGGAGWTSTAPAWVSVSPASASGQALTVASVSVNESALAEMDGGTYSGTITIDAGCSQVAPVTVAVSLDYVKGGSIVVNTNNADATFTISGPETYQGTGTSFQADGVTEGSYTVSFGAVAGFKTPGQVQLDVVNGQTATADGNYRDLRENNGIIVSMAAASTREANEVDFYAVDGTPAGTFPVEGAPAGSLRGKLVTTTVAGDFDGDGVDEVAVAHDSGLITGYEADGSVMAGFEFIAFPDNENVDLAAGDLNGDGQEEIIVGAGSGNKVDAAIRVFTYSSGAILDTGIYFLSSSDMEGVEVAVGDVDGDDIAEIVTASLDVQTADLRLWDVDASGGIGAWSVADIGGFSVPADRGMDLATGDFGADGTVELIVTFNGKGEAPVALYDVSGLSIGSFTVLGTEKLYVAAGDTDGNGTAEIVVCDASKRDPLVTVLAPDGTVLNEFNVFNDIDTNGARVSLGQVVAR